MVRKPRLPRERSLQYLPHHKTQRKDLLEMSDPRNLDKMTEIEIEIGEERLREMLIVNAIVSVSVKKIVKREDKGLRPRKRRKDVVKEVSQEREIRRHQIKIKGMIKRIVLTEKHLTGRIEEGMMREKVESKTERKTEIVNRPKIKGRKSPQAKVKSLKIFAQF